MSALSYNVLSRLKGIETLYRPRHVCWRMPAYNVLSRLKGIETLLYVHTYNNLSTYNVLSRLKGIET